MTAFTVEQIAPLQLVRTSPLAEMYTLSPFVWHEQERYQMLLRAVNHAEIAAREGGRPSLAEPIDLHSESPCLVRGYPSASGDSGSGHRKSTL